MTTTTPRRTVRYIRLVLGLAVAVGVQFAPATGVLAPPVSHAQAPPPPSPPDLGLPPATTPQPEADVPGGTGGGTGGVDGTPRDSGETDDGFGAAVVRTVTEPNALVIALGVGGAVAAALYLRRRHRRRRRERRAYASAYAAVGNLAETDQKTSELLALVSRDLGAPLTAVTRFVDTVRLNWGELPDARRRDLLDRASLSADELNRLVAQLRDFSRLDPQRVNMRPQPILVSAAVERALRDLGPVLADHHVFLDIPDGLAIFADVDAFGDVLTSLLTNAAKFSKAGRRIILSATLVEGAVDMSISDEGIGIRREEQERIFDPFYQSPSNTGSKRGTGIGLTIAKRFTEMQGGEIAVVSEPGLGSTFWITMPAAAGSVRKVGDTHHEVAS